MEDELTLFTHSVKHEIVLSQCCRQLGHINHGADRAA